MAEIVQRTDGTPLFVEEMTKAVLEAKSEGEARKTAAVDPPANRTRILSREPKQAMRFYTGWRLGATWR
jgi:hypothetical protein